MLRSKHVAYKKADGDKPSWDSLISSSNGGVCGIRDKYRWDLLAMRPRLGFKANNSHILWQPFIDFNFMYILNNNANCSL
jgi:hypothetical protein